MPSSATNPPVRERILEVASELFFKQGYHQTGINQIIADSGVAKASFYSHFPSKEDLAVAYVQASAMKTMQFVDTHISETNDPVECYLSFINFIHDFLLETDYRGCNYTNIAREFPGPDSRVRLEVARFENDYRSALLEVVEKLYASDPEKYGNAPLTAQALADRYYLILEGAISSAANFHEIWPVEVAQAAARDLIQA